jgi:predicted translin family RNA/ssDNA-binding protein
METFLVNLASQTEEKRKVGELRFQLLQEAVVRIGTNLDREKRKREEALQQLTEHLTQTFQSLLTTSQTESKTKFEEVQRICQAVDERLQKISFLLLFLPLLLYSRFSLPF